VIRPVGVPDQVAAAARERGRSVEAAAQGGGGLVIPTRAVGSAPAPAVAPSPDLSAAVTSAGSPSAPAVGSTAESTFGSAVEPDTDEFGTAELGPTEPGTA
jgi:hypothetical protein